MSKQVDTSDLFAQLLATPNWLARRPTTPVEKQAVATIRVALAKPRQFDDRRPHPLLGRYRVTRPLLGLAQRVARRYWTWRAPCCLGHRYGHAWPRYERVPITQGGGGTLELAPLIDRSWVPLPAGWAAMRVLKDQGRAGVVNTVDYYLLLQGPPEQCPTCMRPPHKRLREAWLDFAERHRP